MRKYKVGFVTGNRADYYLLRPLITTIKNQSIFALQLFVTGAHLSDTFGFTKKSILNDGVSITAEVDVLLSSQTSIGIAKSVGLGVIGFADAFAAHKPDIVIVLGDRFEILAATQAAFFQHIPVYHFHGGETTLGALDNEIRHAITKFSTCHFVANHIFKDKVISLGENKDNVFVVGAPGLDNCRNLKVIDKSIIFKELNIKEKKHLFLITYHPETSGENFKKNKENFELILSVLSKYRNSVQIFSYANCDEFGNIINESIDNYILKNKNSYVFNNLGSVLYLNIMKHADCVIGNSSSGVIEAPYFKTPTINIGDRQKGRIFADSVFNVSYNYDEINNAILKTLSNEFVNCLQNSLSLYGSGNCSDKFKKIILGKFNLNQSCIKNENEVA